MTITIELLRLFFWRRISELEKRAEQLALGLKLALEKNETLEKKLNALLIADGKKPAQIPRLRNSSEINAFLGETFDAPS